MQTMQSQPDRINRLQKAHPWLTSDQAGMLLVAAYFRYTRLENLNADEVQAGMEETTNELTLVPTWDLKAALSMIET